MAKTIEYVYENYYSGAILKFISDEVNYYNVLCAYVKEPMIWRFKEKFPVPCNEPDDEPEECQTNDPEEGLK